MELHQLMAMGDGVVTTNTAANDNTPRDWYVPSPPAAYTAARVARAHLPPVVALTGHAGAGKSTAAQHLVRAHGYTLVKFAGPLKAMMRAIGLGEREIEGDLKEVPSALLCGRTPRHAMQTLGTEWGRDMIGQDFWTNVWSGTVADVLDQGGRVVCDDCRFPNEADAVIASGGVVAQVWGRGGISGAHASEIGGLPAEVSLFNGEDGTAWLAYQVDQWLDTYVRRAACGWCRGA